MTTIRIPWGLLILCGWFFILWSAAVILPPAESRFSARHVLLLLVTAAWLLLTAVRLVLYLYRGWLRFPRMPNKTCYGVWLGLETAGALAGIGWLIWVFAFQEVCSIKRMRELTLQQDLFVMRSIVSQYTLDKHQRPQSLDDLFRAGYLKAMPIDPMTGRSDTWVIEWSDDPGDPGIEDIHSGSSQK